MTGDEHGIFRKRIINEIIPHAEKDPRIVLLIGDMGFGCVEQFKEYFPKRIYNIGIMEQGMIGIAAGLSMAGLRPVVYTMVNFLAFRALEQIRNDIVLQDIPVKLIGTGANDYFNFLGKSHCAGDDDITIMQTIGMRVYNPFLMQEGTFANTVEQWISSDGPAYIRV